MAPDDLVGRANHALEKAQRLYRHALITKASPRTLRDAAHWLRHAQVVHRWVHDHQRWQ